MKLRIIFFLNVLLLIHAMPSAPFAADFQDIKTNPEARGIFRGNDKPLEGMVFIKGGCFEMGDTFGDGGSDEKPAHTVCVDDFYLGGHEVKQGEWQEVMGNNPSFFNNCGKDCPVERVSWNDVQEFIKKLNSNTGTNYRLPSEAEWEYAAREGGKKVKWAGTSSRSEFENYAWYDDNSRKKTHPVRTKKPNALGLCDMSGNVWEWVSDRYGKKYYWRSLRDNPKGSLSGSYRVLRGGSWIDLPEHSRTTFRLEYAPQDKAYSIGFRLARSVMSK